MEVKPYVFNEIFGMGFWFPSYAGGTNISSRYTAVFHLFMVYLLSLSVGRMTG
jgi:hypothetical protein